MRFYQQAVMDFKTWNRNIRVFFLANGLFQIGSGMFMVLYNLYIQSLGYGDEMNGTIISLQSLATALMFVPIGFLGDRTSRKWILIAGALFTGLGFVGRSYVVSEWGLHSLAIFSGLFAACFQVIAVPFLAENTRKEQRLQLFSYHFALGLAWQVLGSMGGGYMADLLQTAGWSKVASLQTVLMVGGVASFAAFLPLLFVLEQKKVPTVSPSATEIRPKSLNPKLEWRDIRRLTYCQLLVGLGSGLVVPYLNLYFTNRFSVSLTSVGILISLGQVMTIISMLIGPTLVKRVGQVKAIVIFQMLSLPFLLLTGFTNLILIASVSFLFRQALMNAANPIQSAVMVDRISDSRRGIANSLTQTAFMLGWASMGSVQSYLVTTYGYYWGYAITFSMTGILYVTSAICYYFMFKEKKAPIPLGISKEIAK
ncbi:MFS transporter [Paenibacillus sp. MER TA 81-3]|uniref:MFS transporter n=1 Tax=Paenibacillus sp. MER TA 81-3 TaxID=2939573 RepID=UPI002041F3CB|nr:MFS transporter [Paenibacillus sp. MER TA 81-3]MCM3340971.1 MFS transporter [Paenibacillus sp. MER TA 81-3]